MRKRIVRVSPVQSGKVLAVLYGILSIPFALMMAIAALFGPKAEAVPWGFVAVVPVLYIVFGFIFTVIAAWLYNLVAKWTGGIEFESEEQPDA